MTPGRFALLVTAVVLAVQAAWIVAVPPFRGIDEFDHAYRAAAVAHGEWVAGGYPKSGRGFLVTVPDDIVRAASAQCASLSYTGHDNCFPAQRVGHGMVTVGSGAGGYEPLFYWVVGKAGQPFHGAAALYAMRIAAALICALLIGAAAFAVAALRGSRWLRYALLVAVTPMVLFTTILPAPNGAEIAAGLLTWAALLALPRLAERRHELPVLLLAVLGCVLLAGLRMLGPGFLVVIVVLSAYLGGQPLREVVKRHRGVVVLGTALVVTVAVGQVLWLLLWPAPSGTQPDYPKLLQSAASSAVGMPAPWWATGWLLYPLQSIAAFPYRDQPGPIFAYPVFLLVFGGFLWWGFRRSAGRQRTTLVALCLGVTAMPYVLNAVNIVRGRDAIWQGRYGLALAVGIPLLAGLALEGRTSTVRSRWLALTGVVAVVVVQAACIVKVLVDEGHRHVSASDPGWVQPPVWVVLALLVAAAALVASALRGTGGVEQPAVGPAHQG